MSRQILALCLFKTGLKDKTLFINFDLRGRLSLLCFLVLSLGFHVDPLAVCDTLAYSCLRKLFSQRRCISVANLYRSFLYLAPYRMRPLTLTLAS